MSGEYFAFAVIVLFVVGFAGWVANLVRLIFTKGLARPGMLALRVIGIFVPVLGAILGFLR